MTFTRLEWAVLGFVAGLGSGFLVILLAVMYEVT